MEPRRAKTIRKMSRWRPKERRRSLFLRILVGFCLGASPVTALGYFLGDTKAVLNGCEDHWTLQDSTPLPSLSQMSVCLDVRVVAPGAWVGFSYSSPHAPKPELGLEGDGGALYGWLLGVRHRFHVSLATGRWHRVCLRRDVGGNSFSLELAGRLVAKRTVVAKAIAPSGSLWLGCRPRRRPPGAALGKVEIYMFRVWDDLARRGACEDGGVVGWNSRFWGVTSPRARQMDPHLPCAETPEFGGSTSSPWMSSTDSRHGDSQSTAASPGGHLGVKFPAADPRRDMATSSSPATGLDDITSPPPSSAPLFDPISSRSPTRERLLTSANNVLLKNWTPASLNDTSHSYLTTTSSSSAYIKTTRYNVHVPNDTTVNNMTQMLPASSNNGLDIKITTSRTVPPLLRHPSLYNLATPSLTSESSTQTTNKNATQLPNEQMAYKVSTNSLPPSTNTHEYKATPVNTKTLFKDTAQTQQLLPLITNTTTTVSNKIFESNLSTITPLIKDTSLLPLTTTNPLNSNVTAVTPYIKDTSETHQQSPLSVRYENNKSDNTSTTIPSFIKDTSPAKRPLSRTTTPSTLTNKTLANNLTSVITPLINDTSQAGQVQPLTITSTMHAKYPPKANLTTIATKIPLKDTPPTNPNTQFSASADVTTTPKVVYDNHPTPYVTTTLTINLNETTARHLIKDTSPFNFTTVSPKSFGHPTTHDRDNAFPVSTLKDSDAEVVLNTTIGAPRELLARILTTTEVSPSNNVASLNGEMNETTTAPPSGINTVKNLEEQAKILLERTWDPSQLNSSQVAQLVWELEQLVHAPTVSEALAEKIVGIVSNLMDCDPLALVASCIKLINLVEDLTLKLLIGEVPTVVPSRSLVLAVRKVDGSQFPETWLNIFGTGDVQMDGAVRARKWDSTAASVYLPSSITAAMSDDEKKQIDRVQFTFYTKPVLFQDSTLSNQTAVSPVLASSISNMSIGNLSDNIRFTIRNSPHINVNSKAICVFWDFDVNGGGGGWSSDGCLVVSATWWGTTCSCNHLTAFAILLDLSRGGINDPHQAQILTFVTYMGCGLSSIFLAATLLTYLCFAKLLRDIPAKILVQLCSSLLLLNLVYLLDGWLARYPARGLCVSTAFFLHYFLLMSFTWAGLEALHMYLSIVRVFTPYLSRYMLKFSLIGWGIPAVVVVVVISVDKDNYGLVSYGRYEDGTSGDFCWLRSDVAFYVGVVAYFLVVFASCLLVFGVVMAQLRRIKKQNPHNQSPHRGLVADLRSIAGLVALLGLAWGFALFAWGPLYLPFVYLFTVFNSLQGFFVFVFHCACKENVRRQWRTYLCCGRLRLAENSEWSRTATREKRNLSVTSSARQLASRSSSLVSNCTNSSGSAFADSGVSEGSGCDVVLNEFQRKTAEILDASTR